MWKTQKEKEHSQVRMEKKGRGDLLKGLLNQAPPSAHPPCWQHPTHTHPKQRPTTQCRRSHTLPNTLQIPSPARLHTFSLKCQWKGALAECGASFFVCLFGVHASCPEFDLLKEAKKERKMKSESEREADLWEWLADVLAWFQPMRGSGVSPSPFNCKSQWLIAIG